MDSKAIAKFAEDHGFTRVKFETVKDGKVIYSEAVEISSELVQVRKTKIRHTIYRAGEPRRW